MKAPSVSGTNGGVMPFGGVLLAAASKLSVETVRKQARVSVAPEHPTSSTTKSYVPCTEVTSPVDGAEPELMIPARNKPWGSPPLANRWKKTEIEPALSPQLSTCQRGKTSPKRLLTS